MTYLFTAAFFFTLGWIIGSGNLAKVWAWGVAAVTGAAAFGAPYWERFTELF